MSSTILVMDDDLLALESLEDYLKQANYTVVAASSAREAVDKAAPGSMGLISNLLDSDGDGQIMDDVMKLGGGLLGNLFGRKR